MVVEEKKDPSGETREFYLMEETYLRRSARMQFACWLVSQLHPVGHDEEQLKSCNVNACGVFLLSDVTNCSK